MADLVKVTIADEHGIGWQGEHYPKGDRLVPAELAAALMVEEEQADAQRQAASKTPAKKPAKDSDSESK